MNVTQLYLTHCDTHGLVHWILQARILEWVAFLFSWGSSQPREDRTLVSRTAGGFFTSWATRALYYKSLLCIQPTVSLELSIYLRQSVFIIPFRKHDLFLLYFLKDMHMFLIRFIFLIILASCFVVIFLLRYHSDYFLQMHNFE